MILPRKQVILTLQSAATCFSEHCSCLVQAPPQVCCVAFGSAAVL